MKRFLALGALLLVLGATARAGRGTVTAQVSTAGLATQPAAGVFTVSDTDATNNPGANVPF